MQKILDLINPVLDSEPMTDVLRARLRVKLMRVIAANHREINQVLQQELGEVRQKAEDLLYPVPLDRMERSGGDPDEWFHLSG